MTDLTEKLVECIAEKALKEKQLSIENISQCYHEIKIRYEIEEPEETSKKWCEYLNEKFTAVDVSKLNRKEQLVKALYAIIAK